MEGKATIVTKDKTLEITLKGGLDAANAAPFSDELQKYQGQGILKMVIFARELNYISSAGIRALVYAVQKILQPGSDAFFICGQSDVIAVLKMTGLDTSFIFQDTYEGRM